MKWKSMWNNSKNVTWLSILGSISIIYFLWWAITAVGVVWLILLVFKTALLGWIDKGGWRFAYGLGGAIFLIYVILRIGPSLLSVSIEFAREQGLIGVVVGTVLFGGVAILAIPLTVAGWPLWLWITLNSKES